MDSGDYTGSSSTGSSSTESEKYECKKITIVRRKRKTNHDPAKSKKCHGRKRQRSDSSEETLGSSIKPARSNKKVKDKSKKKPKTSTKKVENHRCCPHMIPAIIKRLSPKQKAWVKNIGWGVFLEMPECQLPKPLTMWLVSKVNTKDKTLEIDSQNTIHIEKGIQQYLGLPNGNIKIPQPKSLRTLPKAKKADPDPSSAKFSEHGRGKKLPKIINELVENDDEDDFCISFVMVILAIYLAPGTSQALNRGFLPHIQDVKKIKEMNWCDFAVQYLMKGINQFRSNVHTNINLQGCVHILLLVYITAIRSSKIIVPPGSPTMIFVTTSLLDLLAEEDQKDFEGSTREYGFLMSNEQDKNMVAARPTIAGDLYLTCPSMMQQSHASTEKSEASKELQCNKALQCLFLELKSSINRSRAKIIAETVAKMADSESQLLDIYLEKAKEIVMVNKIMSQDKSVPPHSKVEEVDQISKTDHIHSAVDFSDQGISLQDVADIGSIAAREAIESHEMDIEDETHQPDLKCHKDQSLISGAVSVSFSPGKITDPNGNQQQYHQVVEGVDCPSPSCLEIAQQSTQYEVVPPSPLGSVSATQEINSSLNQSEGAIIPHLHPIGHLAAGKESMQEYNSTIDKVDSPVNLLEDLKQKGSEIPGDAQLPAGNLDQTETGNKPEANSPSWDYTPQQNRQVDGPYLQPGFSTGTPEWNKMQPITDEAQIAWDSTPCTIKKDDKPNEDVATSPTSILERLKHVTIGNETGNISDCNMGELNKLSTDLHANKDPTESIPQSEGTMPLEEHDPDIDLNEIHEIECSLPAKGGNAKQGQTVGIDLHPSPPIVSLSDTLTEDDINDDAMSQVTEPVDAGLQFNSFGVKSSKRKKLHSAKTYREQVINAQNRATSRTYGEKNHASRNPKVRICGYHITEKEFISALVPTGEVDLNFMNICCIAIMKDSASSSKLILDQSVVKKLLKAFENCDHAAVTAYLKKHNLEDVEQLYLPVCEDGHWILIVVNIRLSVAQIYESLREVKIGEHPYEKMWNTVAKNLHRAYCLATSYEVKNFLDFNYKYPKCATQDNNHDCGFYVIRLLECHDGTNIVNYGQKKMVTYKHEVAHLLVHHEYNDYNPWRIFPNAM